MSHRCKIGITNPSYKRKVPPNAKNFTHPNYVDISQIFRKFEKKCRKTANSEKNLQKNEIRPKLLQFHSYINIQGQTKP